MGATRIKLRQFRVSCMNQNVLGYLFVLMSYLSFIRPRRFCVWCQIFFQTEERMRQKNKIKQKKHYLYHFEIKMLFDVISSIQNWHAKYNVDQSDSDLSFLDENTSFTLTFNRIALMLYLKFLKWRTQWKKDKYFLFVLWKIVLKLRRTLTSNTNIYCLGIIIFLKCLEMINACMPAFKTLMFII